MSAVLATLAPRRHFGLRATPPLPEIKPVLRWRGEVVIAEEGRAKGATLSAPMHGLSQRSIYEHLLAEIAAWADVAPDEIEDDEEGGFRLGGALLATFKIEPYREMDFVPRPPLARCTMKVAL